MCTAGLVPGHARRQARIHVGVRQGGRRRAAEGAPAPEPASAALLHAPGLISGLVNHLRTWGPFFEGAS